MAFATTAFVGGQGGHVIPPYYSDFLRENLWPSMYFRQLGTKVSIPKGYGSKVKIPRWDSPIDTTNGQSAPAGAVTAITSMAEGNIAVSKGLSAESITGEVTQFEGSRSYTDKLILVTRANFIEGALESLGRELAFKIDRNTRALISANSVLRGAGATTNKTITTEALFGKAIAKIGPFFDANNTPRWEDNTLVGVATPLAQYDIYRDVSATGFVSVARYNDATKIYRGEVGQMFGIRLLLSNAVVLTRGATGSATATQGLSGGATGSHVWVFAPDAFYALELEDGGLEVLHMPPGSSGSMTDPTAKRGSVAVKVWYGVAPNASADQRLMRFAHGLGLHY